MYVLCMSIVQYISPFRILYENIFYSQPFGFIIKHNYIAKQHLSLFAMIESLFLCLILLFYYSHAYDLASYKELNRAVKLRTLALMHYYIRFIPFSS